MRNPQMSEKRRDWIYAIAILLLTVRYFIFYSALLNITNVLDKLLLAAGLGGCCLTIWYSPRKKTENVVYVCLGAMALYTSYATRSFMPITTLLCIIAVGYGGMDVFLRISRWVLWGGIGLQSVLVTAQYFFLGENLLYMIDTVGNQLRFKLGFAHANTLAFCLIHLMLIDLWQNYGNKRCCRKFFLLIKVAIGYFLTRSESLLCVLLLGLVLFRLAEQKTTFVTALLKLGAQCAIPVCAAVTYFLARYYSVLGINEIFSRSTLLMRFKQAACMLEMQGLSWLGKTAYTGPVDGRIYWGLYSTTFDNVYSFLFISIGIVWLFLLGLFFFKAATQKDNRVNVLLILWAAYGLVEVHGMHASVFLPLVTLSILINGDEKMDEKTLANYKVN